MTVSLNMLLETEPTVMFKPFSIDKYNDMVASVVPIRANGRVQKIVGLVIEASGPASQIGCVCDITTEGGTGTANVWKSSHPSTRHDLQVFGTHPR